MRNFEYARRWDVSNVATAGLVSLSEAKAHLNIAETETHFDTYLDTLIQTVGETLDIDLCRPVRQQTHIFRFAGLANVLVIDRTPVQTVTEVAVVGETVSVVSAGEYEVLGDGVQNWQHDTTISVKPNRDGWSELVHDAEEHTHLPLRVTAVMGWASASVPESIKRVALMAISDMFTARGEQLPMQLSRLQGIAGSLPSNYRYSHAGTQL